MATPGDLVRAIDASLQGDRAAQAYLEGLATPDLSAGPEALLGVWEACLSVLAASSPGDGRPHSYFAACLLRRNVRQQWPRLPQPTRAQLAQATWEGLSAFIRRAPRAGSGGTLAMLGADPAASMVVGVAVAQAVGIESPREEAHAAARALLTQALSPPAEQDPSVAAHVLLVNLRALAGLAEEAREGFGGKLGDSVLPEMGPRVCELALQVLGLAAATNGGGGGGGSGCPSFTPADRAVLLEACAQAITGWAPYGGVTWSALGTLGSALEQAMQASAGASPRAMARVADALEDMAEAVAARAGAGDEEGAEGEGEGELDMSRSGALRQEEEATRAAQRDEGLGRLIAAYLRLFGLAQGDTEALHAACRAVVHLLRQPRVRKWVMLGGRAEASSPVNPQSHALVMQALGILLQGADAPHRPTSATCLEVWVDLHKAGLAGRPSDLGAPLYERLLEVVLRRAQYPPAADADEENGGDDDDDEEEGDEGAGAGEGRVRWGEYREQTLHEVLYRCQEVLRSRYLILLEAGLQPALAAFLGGGPPAAGAAHDGDHHDHDGWQPLEARVFALRTVGLDLAKRALLRSAAPQALANTARIAKRALGLEQDIPLEEVRAEAERTHELLLAMLRPLLALPASSPKPLPPRLWVGLVRCLQPMAQLLGKAQDPALVEQALALVTHSLRVPACCPFAVDAARALATRCGPILSQAPQAVTALLAVLHATPLTADEASTLAAALLPLLGPAPDALATPVLQRLAAAAEAPPESFFEGRNGSGGGGGGGGGRGRQRLLADVAVASTLLRRLPPTLALDFLSQAWPSLRALTLRSASLAPTDANGGSSGSTRRLPGPSQRAAQQPPALLLAGGLLDALTRAATLPLSARAEARNRGRDGPDGGGEDGTAGARAGEGVVGAVVQAMQEGRLSTRAPETFVGAVGLMIEAWGPTVEQGLGLAGEAEAVAVLLDEVGEAVARAVAREEVEVMEAAVQTWASCLDMCPGATMGRPAFQQRELPAAAAWAASSQTHEFAQSAMVLLTSFLELPARLGLEEVEEEGGEEDPQAAEWRKGMLTSWQGALEPTVPSLAVALVLGMMGTAPETTLDALLQLLRALLLRFPDPVFALLQPLVQAAQQPPEHQAVALPPGVPAETAQALIQQLQVHRGLQSRLLPLLSKALGHTTSGGRSGSSSSSSAAAVATAGGWMDLSLFRDLGSDVWAYCQGTKGADCLDRYL